MDDMYSDCVNVRSLPVHPGSLISTWAFLNHVQVCEMELNGTTFQLGCEDEATDWSKTPHKLSIADPLVLPKDTKRKIEGILRKLKLKSASDSHHWTGNSMWEVSSCSVLDHFDNLEESLINAFERKMSNSVGRQGVMELLNILLPSTDIQVFCCGNSTRHNPYCRPLNFIEVSTQMMSSSSKSSRGECSPPAAPFQKKRRLELSDDTGYMKVFVPDIVVVSRDNSRSKKELLVVSIKSNPVDMQAEVKLKFEMLAPLAKNRYAIGLIISHVDACLFQAQVIENNFHFSMKKYQFKTKGSVGFNLTDFVQMCTDTFTLVEKYKQTS